ncbi:MAG: nickel pincer cofactor biosynthesis protein LarB [Candidatus Mariimomonas ferrooxydans]
MDNSRIKKILKSVKTGSFTVDKAFDALKHLPYEDIGIARVDHHRTLRQGIPEVIYAGDKKIKDIEAIAESMLKSSKRLLITRADMNVHKKINLLCKRYNKKSKFHERSGVITAGGYKKKSGMVGVLCAGTSDMSVAEEAFVTASFLGSRVKIISDVGVAGLHRLADAGQMLSKARVLIVVAGMEGALPSVIGGMTDKPIIAVPTSVGYGTSLGGLTALFAMLNSCVPGIAVMNIDNGFGAGVLAHKINTIEIKG